MDIINLLRVRSWVKNLLVLAPTFFGGLFLDFDKVLQAILAFIVFCLTSSAAYVINDIYDIGQDRKHDSKKFRPIASGKISVNQAKFLFLFLIILIAGLSIVTVPEIIGIVCAYLVLNFFYSRKFKHVPIFDIAFISIFFLLRIIAGGLSVDVKISYWLIICTTLLSIFIIVGKRISECNQINKREVLHKYSLRQLNKIFRLSAILTLVSYSIYVFLVVKSLGGYISIVFVFSGLIRYVYLVKNTSKAEYPENILIQDKIVGISVLSWIITMVLVFYI